MATQNLPSPTPRFSTANLPTNLELFNRAYSALSIEQQSRFLSYFVGALSTMAPHNDWVKAMNTATRIIAAGKKPSASTKDSLPLF